MADTTPAAAIDASLCDRYVIFLDIDGVLLPVPRFTFGGGDLSPESVQRLGGLITHLGGREKVTIVLSSTWRNSPDSVARLNEFITRHAADTVPLVRCGTDNGTVLVTQVDYYADDPTEQRLVRDRVDEIERWLHTHVVDHPEAIAGRWFAIDDMKLDVDARMADHFLYTQTDVGITDEDVARATEMVAAFPAPAEAATRAQRALQDPALKQEEIRILEVLLERKAAEAEELRRQLADTAADLARQRELNKEAEKNARERERRLEDVSYRLALYDFSKRHETLREAVELCEKITGPDRKAMNESIRTVVNLLREKKELEKRVRADMKKANSKK
ncbi:hypothetical protein STCU_00229 [Strigomonas culicis]|uniref:Uncharacterized protein n=1 Tax=Strigomonas culicis TaxID=28005 RepID=S9V8E9_9TRYP|nr:hypothetical protein STCU_00229 [Strigomonas culicis]|eukprot:EPY37068.1 hypothetical protein STCU_00229 [Strigomonas culicis]